MTFLYNNEIIYFQKIVHSWYIFLVLFVCHVQDIFQYTLDMLCMYPMYYVVIPDVCDIIPDKKSGRVTRIKYREREIFIRRTRVTAKCVDALNINEARYEGWLTRSGARRGLSMFVRPRQSRNPAPSARPVIISADLRVVPFENHVSLYAELCRAAGLHMRGNAKARTPFPRVPRYRREKSNAEKEENALSIIDQVTTYLRLVDTFAHIYRKKIGETRQRV